MNDLVRLRRNIGKFASETGIGASDTPKNMAMSVCIEAAELLECFQWDNGDGSSVDRRAVTDEIADVLIYLIRLGELLDIDLAGAVVRKLQKNRRRGYAKKAARR